MATGTVRSDKLVIYAPASTSSIPVILAVSKMPNAELTLYTNQSQANTLFLRGDISILVTGLSVGVDMFNNGAPVQMTNSFVSGLSYLVTYGKQVTSLADLKGQQIYIPFAGSPIEEATSFLAQKAGMQYKTDLTPVYSVFDSSAQLLKEGKATAVVLPEPYVTLVEGQPNISISLSYFDEWNKATGTDQGYPQVGSFVNSDWAKTHGADIAAFDQALGESISLAQSDPSDAVTATKTNYKLSEALLLKSLGRTRFNLVTDQSLQETIDNYYTVIGKPLDEKFSAFYYLATK
jgi:NitT/TauT family transport system substrate-binding protein